MGFIAENYIIFIIAFFCAGYLGIILERFVRVNKTAVAILMAVLCWAAYFVSQVDPVKASLFRLNGFVAEVSQIIFFLLGAMTLVEVVDSHDGFRIVTDMIQTVSKRRMLWLICIATFFLSSVLDNLTTTILMVSLLRKLIPDDKERSLFSCMVIIAANAGGAWTPIGDVTTTMLWIDDRLSSLGVVKALFIPSVVSLLIPLLYFHFKVKGTFGKMKKINKDQNEPGSRPIFFLGVAALIFVPIFKGITGMPPFMGMLLGLAVLWIATDLMHYRHSYRDHLKIPHVLSRIDHSAILFFLGILLAVDALTAVGVLANVADWLNTEVSSLPLIATFIGLFSAIMDNVPLVAATMGMYSLEQFPIDDTLWHMIAYAAGTGGSILIIGSSAGIALMGIERIDFFSYMKRFSIPVLIGYLAGMGVYLLIN